jgi:hypothetical protein
MTATITRAEALNAYVTDLEQYVSAHGHLPAANRSTPATNRRRLESAMESPRTGKAMRDRLKALLEAPGYGSRRVSEELPKQKRKRSMATILTYLDRLESYANEHGYLPPTDSSAPLWTDRPRLSRYAGHPDLDESVKLRSQALLALPRRGRVREEASHQDFEAVPAAVSALAKPLSAAQSEVIDWIVRNRKLPKYRGGDVQERSLNSLLSTARRAVLSGSATLRTTEFVLLIPGLLTEAERSEANSHAAKKRLEIPKRPPRQTALGSLEDRWNKGFKELSAWVEANGALPRRRTFDADEYRVANWLNVQRMQLRDNNLRLEWKERLATIPGALEPREQIRNEAELATTVADFYAVHGRLPRADVPAPEGTVGVRLQKLRRRIASRSLSRNALQILSAIPGATELREQKPPLERLADLEDFVRTTGTFPARNSGGLSNWAYRALNGQGSKRAPEAIRLRAAVAELRHSVPYQVHTERPALAEYVGGLEQHVTAHGHLPSSSKGAVPRFRKDRLDSALASEATDEVLRERIRKVLAAPARPHGRRAAA